MNSNPSMTARLALAAGALAALAPVLSHAQGAVPPSLVTPATVESRIGALEFKDGQPSKATLGGLHPDVHIDGATVEGQAAHLQAGLCRWLSPGPQIRTAQQGSIREEWSGFSSPPRTQSRVHLLPV
jgi:hypothetical protein